MKILPPFKHHDNIQKMLAYAAQIYPRNIKEFLRSPKHRSDGHSLRESYPRLLFEVGFIEGKTHDVRRAVGIDNSLVPEKETNIDIMIHNIETNKVHRSMGVQYIKPAEFISWQHWRLESILSSQYLAHKFSEYNRYTIVNVSLEGTGIETNHVYIPEAMTSIDIPTTTGRYTLNSRVAYVQEQPHHREYRFRVGLQFQEPLTTEQLLQVLATKSSSSLGLEKLN